MNRFLPFAKVLGSPWAPTDLSEDWREHQYQVRTLRWVVEPVPWLQVPIWPTSTWITSFGSHGVRHHGPAPFPARTPVWWVASGTTVGMGSLFAALFLWFLFTPQTHVWVHNGYSFPVEVTAGDETREVGPHDQWDVGIFDDGPLTFGARYDGTLFDVAKVELRGGTASKLIYNVNERGGLRSVDEEDPPFWLGTDTILYPNAPSRVFTKEGYGPVVEAVAEEESGGALALKLGREIGRDHGLRVARAVLELEPDDAEARAAVDELLADDPAAHTAFYESLGP